MISSFSDLTDDERGILAYEARCTADQIDRQWEPTPAAPSSPAAVRWREVADAIQSGGKHLEPCPTCDKPWDGCDFCCGTNTGDGSRERAGASEWPLKARSLPDAGTGGPC